MTIECTTIRHLCNCAIALALIWAASIATLRWLDIQKGQKMPPSPASAAPLKGGVRK